MCYMNILLASDDNYAPLLGVAIYSLLKNNETEFNKINIFVFDEGISNTNKNKLYDISKNFKCNVDLSFIEHDDISKVLNMDIKATRSLSTFARLFATSLLDESIDKILYMDCDALVVDSLKELWETDISDYECGAVADACPTYVNSFLSLPEDETHFNAGLLLINLKKWRENNLEKKFLDFIMENDGEVFHNDQGVINVICKNNILKLHPKYNILSPFFDVSYEKVLKFYDLDNYYSKELVEDAVNNPVFIHLTQFVNGRPWFTNATMHPLRKLFDSYVGKTPFKEDVYVKDNRRFRGKFLSFTYKYLPYSWICLMFRVYRFILIRIKWLYV